MFKVLIVEDERLIRKWLVFGVNYDELNLTVVGEADNGEVGTTMIKNLSPDIVITDISMPVKDAFEMFEATKELSYKKVILSGFSDFDNAKKAIHYGVREFLSKPLDVAELKSTLADLVTDLESEENDKAKERLISYDPLEVDDHKSNQFVQTIIKWVHQHYFQKKTVADIAHELGYSESYIHKQMKEQLGMTTNDYISRYRIKVAVSLLIKDPHLRLYEVAERVGFADYKYFNKVFKKYVGFTVTEFKENIL